MASKDPLRTRTASVETEVVDIQGDKRWMSMHQRFIAEGKKHEADVVLIGDSMIERMQFTNFWKNMFEPLHCLNFGIGGDQIQNVIWRITHGEFDNISPKVVVLLVGTNNIHDSVDDIVDGICKAVDSIRQRQALSHIIVMGILPRGEHPNPLREKDRQVNDLLVERLHGQSAVTFMDIDSSWFVNPSDGTISHQDMHDYLHLTELGYVKILEPLLDLIQDLLHSFTRSGSEADDNGAANIEATGDTL